MYKQKEKSSPLSGKRWQGFRVCALFRRELERWGTVRGGCSGKRERGSEWLAKPRSSVEEPITAPPSSAKEYTGEATQVGGKHPEKEIYVFYFLFICVCVRVGVL